MSKKPSPPDPRIDVTARHGNVSEGMRTYAVQKVSKLNRFHPRISRIQLLLDDPQGEREVELIVHVDNGPLFVAKERAGAFHAAVDVLVDKMERQLKKDKEKHKDHKAESPKGEQPPESGGDSEESYEDIVRRDLG